MTIKGKANLIIKGEHHGLTFEDLYVHDGSVIEFGQQKDIAFIVLKNSIHISKYAILDFIKTENVMIYQEPGASLTETPLTTIGTIFFRKKLGIVGTNVDVIGDVKVFSRQN